MTILEQAYIELEAKSIQEESTYSLSSIFRNVRDTLTKNGEPEEATKAQYEIDILNFGINENKLSFYFSGTNEKGEPFEYPSIKLFTDEEFNYLIDRQKSAKSESLKARYSHILWLSPKKKIEYAQTAIDNYLKLIKIREKQDSEFPKGHFGLAVIENIKNAFLLSLSVKYKVEITKKEIIRLIKKYSDKSDSAYELIKFMLEQKSVFKEADFKGIVKVCEQMILKLYPSRKYFVICILNLIIKVEKKLKNETADYERRIAKMWEELSYDRKDETNIASLDLCTEALKIYKKLKDTAKIKELEKRFNELRKNTKLSPFERKIDLTERLEILERLESYRKCADKITDNEPFFIINSLMTDKRLLPTLDEFEKQSKETDKNCSSLNFSIIFHDIKGNTAQRFYSEEESEYYNILLNYRYSLEKRKINLIREIIFSGVKKGKLNATTFLSFLQQHSWLGKELELSSNGKKIPYCWLALIAPALNEYFINLEFFFINQTNFPNFILCIDSLSLKIEGMLRDICEFKGIATFELKPDKKGRTISQEKDIHKLLYEPELADLIDKDDLLFFKFLLVEKAGYNLRHRVAHSLMTFYDYSIDLMNLLIMAVLKLGKYNLVPKTKKDSE